MLLLTFWLHPHLHKGAGVECLVTAECLADPRTSNNNALLIVIGHLLLAAECLMNDMLAALSATFLAQKVPKTRRFLRGDECLDTRQTVSPQRMVRQMLGVAKYDHVPNRPHVHPQRHPFVFAPYCLLMLHMPISIEEI